MAAGSVATIPAARIQHDLDHCLWCDGGHGFIGIPYFLAHPEGAAFVNANSRNRVHRGWPSNCSAVDSGVLLAA
jgi:sodium/proline symporter